MNSCLPRWSILIFITLLSLSGCNQDDTPVLKGCASFSFKEQAESAGRVNSLPVPAFISYSIKKANNEIISGKIELYPFNNTFLSVPISLEEGDYTLEEFLILENDNTVIYAAPVSGSELVELVDHPLPLSFNVTHDKTTTVIPEVIQVSSYEPEDFGYASWSYSVGARPVKFVMPVSSGLITKIQSAEITVSQGSYTRTKTLSGVSQLSAELMVKANAPVSISLIVTTHDMYIERLPMNPNMTDDVLLNNSLSQFEFTRTTDLSGSEIVIPQFDHKLGNGWDFNFAEITSHGKNESWFKVKYKKEELCNPTIEITTNASEFESQTLADKVSWLKSGEELIPTAINNFFQQPVCSNGVCKLTANFATQDGYENFASACETSQWVMFDSEIRVTLKHNGKINFLTTYFNLEKTTAGASGRLNAKNQSKVLR